MDKILLNNMVFHGYHGHLSEEGVLGQKFVVDMELGLDLTAAAATDDLARGVCYAEVFALVREAVEQERFKLLEGLGEHILTRIFQIFPQVEVIKIVLKKPQAPVAGIFDYVGIELNRSRNDDKLSRPRQ